MTTVLSFVRTFFISLEFVLLLFATWIVAYRPSWVEWIGARLDSATDGYMEAVLLAPFGFGALTVNLTKEILFPEKDERDDLHSFPGYKELKLITDVAITYVVIFILIGLAAAIKIGPDIEGVSSFLLLVSVTGSAVVWLSCFRARTTINELFAFFRNQRISKSE